MDIHLTTDVFTPTKPARLTFVERHDLNDQLVDSLRTPGKQIVVFGPTGSGKTTLLINKLQQLYPHHVTVRCTNDTSFEGLLQDAFDQLDPFYISETGTNKTRSINVSLSSDYLNIKSGLAAITSTQEVTSAQRAIPLQLTPARLAQFLGEVEACLVLEDFHKISNTEKTKLAQAMKVFMDTADNYRDVKIIAIGAVDTAREVVEYEPEMQNRVSEIRVPLMSKDQLRGIIEKGEAALNLRLSSALKDELAKYSSGLASVVHQLSLNICFAAGIVETCITPFSINSEHLEKAVTRYLKDSSDSLKSAFDKAMKRQRTRKFDNCRLILRALASLGAVDSSHNDILGRIRSWEGDYPSGNLTHYLKQLQRSDRGGVVRFDPSSNKYSFSNPLYLAYAQILFAPIEKVSGESARESVEVGVESMGRTGSGGTFRRIVSDVIVTSGEFDIKAYEAKRLKARRKLSDIRALLDAITGDIEE